MIRLARLGPLWIAAALLATVGCRTVERTGAALEPPTTPVVAPEPRAVEPPPPVVGPDPNQELLDRLAAADRAYEAGDHPTALAAYQQLLEASPAGGRPHRVRFRVAVLLLGGDGAPQNVAAARTHLQQLVAEDDAGAYRAQSGLLLDLLDRVSRLRRDVATLQSQLERVKEIDLESSSPPR